MNSFMDLDTQCQTDNKKGYNTIFFNKDFVFFRRVLSLQQK